MRIPFIAVAALLLAALNGCASNATRIAQVEQGLRHAVIVDGAAPATMNLQARMRHHHVPGVSIAVIENYQLAWARGYGVMQAGAAQAVTTSTLFQAASISKPVAALAALNLVEQGKLQLDEPVNHKLKSWRLPENDFTRATPVTLRQLLSHSAGTTVHGFGGYPQGDAVPTLVQVLDGAPPANSDAVRVDTVPGKTWRYSGGGTSVAQQLMQDVTQESFTALMQRLVLAPLAMTHSTFAQPLPAEKASTAAHGHKPDGSVIKGGWHVHPEQAAAGLWTTPSDLAQFALALMQDTAGASAMLTRQPGLSAQGGRMGLGVFLEGHGRAMRFSHGGSNAGYKCYLIAFPQTGQGAVVMTNGDGGGALLREINRAIAAEYAWPDRLQVHKIAIRNGVAPDAELPGNYKIASGGPTIEIVLRDGQLNAVIGADRATLVAEAADRFFSIESGTEFTFRRDADGRVAGFTSRAISGSSFEAEKVKP